MARSAKSKRRQPKRRRSNSEDEIYNSPPLPSSLSPSESPVNSDLLTDRIANRGADKASPSTPPKATTVIQSVTPLGMKAHNSNHVYETLDKPEKMKQDELEVALKRELKGAMFENIDDLVDNVFGGQTIQWAEIWEQMTATSATKRNKNDKSYNNSTRTWNNWPPTDRQSTEVELRKHLNAVADIVREKLGRGTRDDDLVYSSRFANHGRGTETKSTHARKPDLVIIPRSLREVAGISWKHFIAFVSLKVGTMGSQPERMQLAEYARLAYHAQPDRRYVLAIGFRHTKLTLYVLDRAGILASRVYDVNKNPEQFLRIAIGILFLDSEALGYDTTFSKEDGTRFVAAGRVKYALTKRIYLDRTVRGRGTVCLKATRTTRGQSEVYVVKDSWVDRSRKKKEVEILELLKDRNITNVPQLIHHEIVQVKDFRTGNNVKDSTDIFRGHEKYNVEIRDHHRIVMQPYGEPITRFASLLELIHVMLDILRTIKELDDKGIVHRDISLGNLVIVLVPGSKYRKGFIIDFDYAIEKNRRGTGPAEAERTGTLPFIAIDILKCIVEHAADHDTESLFYVLIWMAFTQAGPNGLKRKMTREQFDKSILRSWSPPGDLAPSSLSDIGSVKRSVMTYQSQFKEYILGRMHPYFNPLKPCLLLLRVALFPSQTETNPDDPFEVSEAIEPDTVIICREKTEVFRLMEVALLRMIERLETLGEAAEALAEPTAGPDPNVATTSGAADDASKEPEFAADHIQVHHMKLRNRVTESEKKQAATATPQDTVPRASANEGRLYEHALRNSHLQHQASLKRSRDEEDDSAGSSSKKKRTSRKTSKSTKATGRKRG